MAERAIRAHSQQRRSGQRDAAAEWLANAAARTRAESAVLLVRRGSSARILACYPEHGEIEDGIATIARRAFQEQRVVQRHPVKGAGGQPDTTTVYIGLSFRVSGRPAVVALRLKVDSTTPDAALLGAIAPLVLRRADDNAVTSSCVSENKAPVKALNPPAALAATRAMEQEPASESPAQVESTTEARNMEAPRTEDPQAENTADELLRRQGAVIHGLATVLDQRDFEKSLHALAGAVAHSWRCLRVTVGTVRADRIVVEAVSNVADFDRRSALIVDMTQVLEEHAQQLAPSSRLLAMGEL